MSSLEEEEIGARRRRGNLNAAPGHEPNLLYVQRSFFLSRMLSDQFGEWTASFSLSLSLSLLFLRLLLLLLTILAHSREVIVVLFSMRNRRDIREVIFVLKILGGLLLLRLHLLKIEN